MTLQALVTDRALRRFESSDGFHFCRSTRCATVYFRPGTADTIARPELRVRVGQKETDSARVLCYCFNHSAREIEDEVAVSGTSTVPDRIAEKCKQGLDRCEQSNPGGSCCLGEIRAVLKTAQAAQLDNRQGELE